MDILYVTIHALTQVWNVGVLYVHNVVELFLPQQSMAAVALTGLLVSSIIAIPLSIAGTAMMMACLSWWRKRPSPSSVSAPASSSSLCGCCGSREVVLKLKVKGNDFARRLAVQGAARRRLRDLERAIVAKLQASNDASGAPGAGSHVKVSRIQLLPDDVVLAEDADLAALANGKELVVELKE